MDVSHQKFYSPSKGVMSVFEVAREIHDYLTGDQKRNYTVVIGTDSQTYTKTDFVTAIVVHRVGAGGRYFWTRDQRDNFKSLRERIYMEALKSLEVAELMSGQLYNVLKNEEKFRSLNIEIHVDIGENGPTREMIKEVVGMIRGNGYEVQIKPLSYGAFVVADRHT